MILAGKTAGQGDVRNLDALVFHDLAVFVGLGVERQRGNPPVLHHVPGAHARSTARSVDGEQVELGIGCVADGHGQGFQSVGTGLQGDALVSEASQVVHRVHEPLADVGHRVQIGPAQAAVPCEGGDGAALEGCLHFRIVGVRVYNVAAVAEELGILQGGDLDFAADHLGALAPLELDDDLIAVLFDEVFGHAVPRVFHVHLNDDGAVAVIVALEDLDPAIQFRRRADLPALELRFLVHAHHVLTDHDGEAADRRARGKGTPVLGRDEGGSQRSGHDRHAALHLHLVAEDRLGVHVGKHAVIGVAGHVRADPLGAVGIPLDPHGVVSQAQGGHVPGACGDLAESARVEHLAPLERRQPRFAFALAVSHAQCAQAALTGVPTVDGSQSIVSLWPLNHLASSFCSIQLLFATQKLLERPVSKRLYGSFRQ